MRFPDNGKVVKGCLPNNKECIKSRKTFLTGLKQVYALTQHQIFLLIMNLISIIIILLIEIDFCRLTVKSTGCAYLQQSWMQPFCKKPRFLWKAAFWTDYKNIPHRYISATCFKLFIIIYQHKPEIFFHKIFLNLKQPITKTKNNLFPYKNNDA